MLPKDVFFRQLQASTSSELLWTKSHHPRPSESRPDVLCITRSARGPIFEGPGKSKGAPARAGFASSERRGVCPLDRSVWDEPQTEVNVILNPPQTSKPCYLDPLKVFGPSKPTSNTFLEGPRVKVIQSKTRFLACQLRCSIVHQPQHSH